MNREGISSFCSARIDADRRHQSPHRRNATPAPGLTPKLSVLVPVFNEVRSLRTLIAAMDAAVESDISYEFVFIDDGSTDGSSQVLEKLLATRGDTVLVRHDSNRGKGAAIGTGLAMARGDFVLIQDADLEYNPIDWPKLLAPLKAGEADVVFGSRFRGDSRGWYRSHWCANRLMSLQASITYGRWITDVHSGYKAFRRTILSGSKLREQGFGVDVELMARCLADGLRYREVPVSYRGRTYAQGKKLTWREGLTTAWAILKYRFWW